MYILLYSVYIYIYTCIYIYIYIYIYICIYTYEEPPMWFLGVSENEVYNTNDQTWHFFKDMMIKQRFCFQTYPHYSVLKKAMSKEICVVLLPKPSRHSEMSWSKTPLWWWSIFAEGCPNQMKMCPMYNQEPPHSGQLRPFNDFTLIVH